MELISVKERRMKMNKPQDEIKEILRKGLAFAEKSLPEYAAQNPKSHEFAELDMANAIGRLIMRDGKWRIEKRNDGTEMTLRATCVILHPDEAKRILELVREYIPNSLKLPEKTEGE